MDILDWDIEGIIEMGVETDTGKLLGRDVSIQSLVAEGYHAIFLALGGWDSRLTRTGGGGESIPVPGCHLLIDIMKAGSQGYPPVKLNGHTVVVGGPNLTMHMIQRIKEVGAEKVTVLMREAAPVDWDDAGILMDHGISRLYGDKDRLTAVELTQIESRQTQKTDADHIIFAAGRMPELVFMPVAAQENGEDAPADNAPATGWEAVPPYKQAAYYNETGLMARGDVLTDFSAAIKAIAAGRRAAASIHRSIYGIGLELPDNVVNPETPIQNVSSVSRVSAHPRQVMPTSDEDQVALGMELERGFDAEAARAEAGRCLQCGLICYRRESAVEELRSAAASS
jgi:formate dehydrogenase beta subunit